MISDPDNIYVIDERATARARRLVSALNILEAKGKASTERYERLLQELNSLSVKNKRQAGVSISVPRI